MDLVRSSHDTTWAARLGYRLGFVTHWKVELYHGRLSGVPRLPIYAARNPSTLGGLARAYVLKYLLKNYTTSTLHTRCYVGHSLALLLTPVFIHLRLTFIFEGMLRNLHRLTS